MTIRDAVLEAHKQGRGIARKSDGTRPAIFIGTNTTECFLILSPDYKTITPKWEPNLDDITANDWYVIG